MRLFNFEKQRFPQIKSKEDDCSSRLLLAIEFLCVLLVCLCMVLDGISLTKLDTVQRNILGLVKPPLHFLTKDNTIFRH